MKKRTFALLLSLVMTLSLLPAPAAAADGDFIIDENGVLTEYVGPGGNVTVPDGVTAIGNYAFMMKEGLKSVTLPSSVTSIGRDCFSASEDLTTVTLSEGLVTIGPNAFNGCTALTQIAIPASVETIDEGAFSSCRALEKVTFASGSALTEIGQEAFAYCTALTSIRLPGGVSRIGKKNFVECSSLSELTLPSQTETIPCQFIVGCASLRELTIPEGVKTIEENAFSNCLVEKLWLPLSLERIELVYLPQLMDVVYAGTQESWAAVTGEGKEVLSRSAVHFEGREDSAASTPLDDSDNWTNLTSDEIEGVIDKLYDGAYDRDVILFVHDYKDDLPARKYIISLKEFVEENGLQAYAYDWSDDPLVWVEDEEGNGSYKGPRYQDKLYEMLENTVAFPGEYNGEWFAMVCPIALIYNHKTRQTLAVWDVNRDYYFNSLLIESGVRDGSGYTVTFDPAGGVLSGQSTFVTNARGQVADMPDDPVRPGYTFLGWSGDFGGRIADGFARLSSADAGPERVYGKDFVVKARWKFGTDSGDVAAEVRPFAGAGNKGGQEYENGGIWKDVDTGYLYENESGGLTRVEYGPGSNDRAGMPSEDAAVIVEEYDSDLRFLSGKTLPAELPYWGGFYAGEEYNFLLFGDSNMAESDEAETLRVVKYSKDWQRLGACSIAYSNTTVPFRGGSTQFAEAGGILYVHTSHEMYADKNNDRHQSNIFLAIRESDMVLTGSRFGIGGFGYVSHSMNADILADSEGNIVTANHGDGYPFRGLMIDRYVGLAGKESLADMEERQSSYVVEFSGEDGENRTGAAMGRLAETAAGYVLAYNDDLTGYGIPSEEGRDIYLAYTDKDTFTTTVTRVTDRRDAGVPVVVPVGPEGGYILWNCYEGFYDSDFSYTRVMKDFLYWTTYDAQGNVGPIYVAEASLSGCRPVVYNGELVWYVSDGRTVKFYTLSGKKGVGSRDAVYSIRLNDCLPESLECTLTVRAGAPLGELPVPWHTDAGQFAGWYTEKDGQGTRIREDYVPTEGMTLYAHWLAKSDENNGSGEDERDGLIWLTFDANGGTIGEEETFRVQTGVGGLCPVSFPIPQRLGYGYLGWFTDPEGGERFYSDDRFTEDTTLYVHWMSYEEETEKPEEQEQPEETEGPDRGVGTFVPPQIVSQGNDPAPGGGMAYASTQQVKVDGVSVEFEMYALKDASGSDTNYVKLRDVAYVLNGTPARFSVGWSAARGIYITTGEEYTVTGSEMNTPYSGDRAYILEPAPTDINQYSVPLKAFRLTDDNGNGYTYYKLRDLGQALGFNVGWTPADGVFLETDKLFQY